MRDTLTAGDTLDFVTTLPDYPASAGWVLSFRLIPQSSGTAIDITTTASGDDHRAAVGAGTTSSWTAGNYSWASYVSKSGERYSVASGTCEILADPATATAFDGRTHARKVLEAIEAVLENRATLDQEEYSIAGRSLKRTPVRDLIRLRSLYANEVRGEEAAERMASGMGGGRRIQVRF